MKKRGILFARNWCFHDFNFKILHSSRFHFAGFVFFAIFGLGKVLWFCVTKVSGKNQSYSNLYWFCKICKLVPKVVKKPSWQDTQKTNNSKKSQNISDLKKFNFKSKKGTLVYFFKVLLCKSLIVLIELLLNCILHVYVKLCTNIAFGRVKRYKTISGT